MKLLTPWQTWWSEGRNEYRFHCDILLDPGEVITITSNNHVLNIGHPNALDFAKVHLAASWEFRETEFVEDNASQSNQRRKTTKLTS